MSCMRMGGHRRCLARLEAALLGVAVAAGIGAAIVGTATAAGDGSAPALPKFGGELRLRGESFDNILDLSDAGDDA